MFLDDYINITIIHIRIYFFHIVSLFSIIYIQMADVDPETLLEWLSMGQGDERDMQLIALEQLCMLLLMSDNVDRCFEWYVENINNVYCFN